MPEGAIRESVANAVCHRNYIQIEGRTLVAVFDDRIEVMSQGNMPSGLCLEEALAGGTMSRNPILTNVFRTAGVTEGWGSGMGKMRRLCREYGLKDPVFDNMGALFKVVLLRPKVFDPSFGPGEADNKGRDGKASAVGIDGLTPAETEVYKAILEGRFSTAESMARSYGLTDRTIKRATESLMSMGLIRRVGSKKTGRWEATNTYDRDGL
ncbi:MAG: hypothetical protein FWD37_01690 [Methanomassiliicoccaceae archaeon]|nr:hypothetical protein [Methanomassiliicoccaceae archaeon]